MKPIYQISFFTTLLVIEYLATTTREIEVVAHSWDKLNHLAAFMVLYILLSAAFVNLKIYSKVMLLMAFAVQIEIVQHFIPGRYFSLFDIVADGIGIVIGWGVWRLRVSQFIDLRLKRS
ncbi:MAG: VanZ family protein [Sulfurovum sp.]|nr:VanZ family protein [Sulfurovum sp.]